MSHFTTAFACDCECQTCDRYLSRVARRPWVGSRFPTAGNTLAFLRYSNQSSSGVLSTAQWSVSPTDYGFSQFTGNDERGVGVPGGGLVNTPGTYRIDIDDDVPPFPKFTLVSFVADITYHIFVHTKFTFLGTVRINDYELSDWFSPARLIAQLESDLVNSEPSFEDPVTHFAPHNDAFRPDAAEFPSGGYFERCEAPPLGQRAKPGDVAGSGISGYPGHGARYISTAQDNFESFLKRTIIYVSGNHSLTDHHFDQSKLVQNNFREDAALSCANLNVASGASYTINPPSANSHDVIWHEKQSCP